MPSDVIRILVIPATAVLSAGEKRVQGLRSPPVRFKLSISASGPTHLAKNRILSSERPVFYGQITDSSELTRIVRNQHQAEAARMSSNEKIVCTDHRAKCL